MTDSRSRATTEGVAEAWVYWLDQHPVSVPELIHDAVTKAVTSWLNQHSEDLIDAIARRHGPLPAPTDISGQPPTNPARSNRP